MTNGHILLLLPLPLLLLLSATTIVISSYSPFPATREKEQLLLQSYHKCVNGDFTNTSWKRQTCHLKNVCFLASTIDHQSSHEFVYFDEFNLVSEDMLRVSLSPLTYMDDRGGHPFTFKVINSSMYSADQSEYKQRLLEGMKNLQFMKDKDNDKKASVQVLYESYNAENFGHFIGDELFPIYRALDIFGLSSKSSINNDVRLIRWIDDSPLYASCDYRLKYWYSKTDYKRNDAFCNRFYKNIFPLFSNNNILKLTKSNNSFCMSDLIVGVGMLSDHCEDLTKHGREIQFPVNCNQGIGNIWSKFRDHLVDNLKKYDFSDRIALSSDISSNDVSSSSSSNNSSSRYQITVVGHLNGLRTPTNLFMMCRDIANKLNISLSDVNFIKSFSNTPIKDQIAIMANTKVLISPSGGSSFIGLFLPKGATMILFIEENEGPLDFVAFNSWSHVDVKYMYLNTSSITRSSSDIDNDNLSDSDKNKNGSNNRNRGGKAKKLKKYVDDKLLSRYVQKAIHHFEAYK